MSRRRFANTGLIDGSTVYYSIIGNRNTSSYQCCS